MRRGLASVRAYVLPRGPLDLLRQILVFCGCYYAYRFVRGAVDSRAGEAFENARNLIDLERALGLFWEPQIQDLAISTGFLEDVASWMYLNSHFVVTVVALAWLYMARNEHFYFVRNMFMFAMGIALVGYAVYPTAPPRFFTEWGFEDSVAAFTGVEASSDSLANALYNPFAAVPSMHVGFALMLAWTFASLAGHRAVRWAWIGYPVLVTWVVIATGNHFWMDAFLGAVTAAAALGLAQLCALARPEAWAFEPRTAPEAARA